MILDNEDILIDNIFSENIIEPIINKITNVQPLDEKEENILKNHVSVYKFCSVEHFKKFIRYIRDNNIYHHLNLNWINTSEITNMSYIFADSNFNGDISKWDTGNVLTMEHMFRYSNFNGDISKWDISNVKDMSSMFINSNFNRDISKWDVSNVKDMLHMFTNSKFNGDISKWNVSNVKDMSAIFRGSNFNGDISKWDVSNVENMSEMFTDSKFNGDISQWKVYSLIRTQNMFHNSKFSGDISNWDLSLILGNKIKLSMRDSTKHKGSYIYYEESIRYSKYLEYDYIELTYEYILSNFLFIDCSNNRDVIENNYKVNNMVNILESSFILLDIDKFVKLYNIPNEFIYHYKEEPLNTTYEYLCADINLNDLTNKLEDFLVKNNIQEYAVNFTDKIK